MNITFRPTTPDDEPFLYRVYASTRMDELAPLQWSEAQITEFLTMQFRAQHTYYHEHFSQASFQIILLDGQPIGRLYQELRANDLHIIDIALLPEYRNQGIGTRLLRDIINEGEKGGYPVSIYVELNNPALRLYHRLGFRQVQSQGVYYYMERQPGATSPEKAE
jgi:ribosomal protein S18 acetylase RimI-like enzyme